MSSDRAHREEGIGGLGTKQSQQIVGRVWLSGGSDRFPAAILVFNIAIPKECLPKPSVELRVPNLEERLWAGGRPGCWPSIHLCVSQGEVIFWIISGSNKSPLQRNCWGQGSSLILWRTSCSQSVVGSPVMTLFGKESQERLSGWYPRLVLGRTKILHCVGATFILGKNQTILTRRCRTSWRSLTVHRESFPRVSSCWGLLIKLSPLGTTSLFLVSAICRPRICQTSFAKYQTAVPPTPEPICKVTRSITLLFFAPKDRSLSGVNSTINTESGAKANGKKRYCYLKAK